MATLSKLNTISQEHGERSETLAKIALKPFWNVVVGSAGHCGIAMNYGASPTGQTTDQQLRADVHELRSLVGQELFEVVPVLLDRGNLRYRSIATAALSALSQPWLTTAALRERGFMVEEGGGNAASLVEANDVVAMVGYAGILNRHMGAYRELHVTEMRPRDAFQTIVIGPEVQFGPTERFRAWPVE